MMNFPQIRLESTNAQIELRTQNASLEMEQPQADLSIQQPAADLEIDRRPATLSIDQTKAREDMDLKHISKRIEEAAELGYKDWLNGMARVSQDGDELMMIENGGNAIAEQAKRNSEPPIYEFNIGWIPSAGAVQINYDPGNIDIRVKTNKPIIESKQNKPIYQYSPGKVEASIKQHASLYIDFDNLKYVGTNYEQKI